MSNANRIQKNHLDKLETRLKARYGDAWDGNKVRCRDVLPDAPSFTKLKEALRKTPPSSYVSYAKTYKIKLRTNRTAA